MGTPLSPTHRGSARSPIFIDSADSKYAYNRSQPISVDGGSYSTVFASVGPKSVMNHPITTCGVRVRKPGARQSAHDDWRNGLRCVDSAAKYPTGGLVFRHMEDSRPEARTIREVCRARSASGTRPRGSRLTLDALPS